MYYGARYYNPVLGRFITADTIVPYVNNPQALNRYSYAGNNPVSHFEDGNGWFIPFIIAAIKGATIGAAVGAGTAAITGGDIGRGALFGAIGGAAFSGLSSGFNSLAKFAMTGTTNVSLIGSAANSVNILGATLAGAGSGAAVASSIGSNVGSGALVGLAAATITGFGSRLWPLGANALAGGAASEIEGGDFGDGAINGAYNNLATTAAGLLTPMATLKEQDIQPGDVVYFKPGKGDIIGTFVSFLEGGPFAHVGTVVDGKYMASADPAHGTTFQEWSNYRGRQAYINRRFEGNQKVISAAGALAVSSRGYGFVGSQRVCSTTCASAFNQAGYRGWYGIGPNGQAATMGYSQFRGTRMYGE